MKDYLNYIERTMASYYLIFIGIIQRNIDDYQKNMSKEEITNLKYARTYMIKYSKALLKRVGEGELRKLQNIVQNNILELKRKDSDSQLIVDKDSMEEIARMAVEANCFGCERCDFHNCGLFKFMYKAGMTCTNDRPDKCDFYYEKKD